MDQRDLMFLSAILGFPVLVGALASVWWLLARRASTVVCPRCGRRFAKTAIRRSGIRCRHCDWQVVPRQPE